MPWLRVREIDTTALSYIQMWLREAGGRMAVQDLVFKYQRRFNCLPNIYPDDLAARIPELQGFRIEDNFVHLPH